MAKPVRSRLDRLVEESRQPQAAPYLSTELRASSSGT
jgi:hypothetical protein